MKSWTTPTPHEVRCALFQVTSAARKDYFFQRLRNPLWAPVLKDLDVFKEPPPVVVLPDGMVRVPRWPQSEYLSRVACEAPMEIASVALSIPTTDNPRILEDLLAVSRAISDPTLTAQFLPHALRYLAAQHVFSQHILAEIIVHWAKIECTDAALTLLGAIASFDADPRAEEKARIAASEPENLWTGREPVPRLRSHDYSEVLFRAVRALAEAHPIRALGVLVPTLANFVRLRVSEPDERPDDNSEIWCRQIDEGDEHEEPVCALVHAVAHTLCQVLRREPEKWEDAVRLLRKQQWNVFKRILWHTCAAFPDTTGTTITEELLGNLPTYRTYQYDEEFAEMIFSCIAETGGVPATAQDKEKLFTLLREEPGRDDLRGFDGERLTDEHFAVRRKRLMYRRLKPFESILPSDLADKLKEVDTEEGELTSSDYARFQGGGEAREVVTRSPATIEDLAGKSNDELASFINIWAPETSRHDRADWWVEIGVGGLAGTFAEVLKRDPERFLRWDGWWREIRRPVFLRRALGVAIEQAKAGTIDWAHWLRVCRWIVEQRIRILDPSGKSSDESFEFPDWTWTRSGVVELLDTAFSREVNMPLRYREEAFAFLKELCGGEDPSLDTWRDEQERDPLQKAINTTRGKAIEVLADYGWWVRQWQKSDSPLDEIWPVLDGRIHPSHPDAAPIFAIIAMNLPRFCGLNREWVEQRRDWLFPRDNPALWRDAWQSFVRYTHAWNDLFAILRGEYRNAVSLVPSDDGSETRSGGIAHPPDEALGGHLMTLYWRGVLERDDPLMTQFFERAAERTRASVAQMAIHALRKTGSVPPEVLTRFQNFFEWRLSAAPAPDVKSISEHPWSGLELIEYGDWLECDKFPAEWRLRQVEALLNRAQVFPSSQFDIASLSPLLPDHLAPVTKCLHLFVSRLPEGDFHYWKTAEMRTLLRAAIQSEDAAIKHLGEQTRDLLLKRGLFDFMELDEPPESKKSPSNP